jgi:hypothetical protein
MMNDRLKASVPSRQRSQNIGAKPLGKNAASAENGITPKTANRHPQENAPTGDRQIGGLPQISALPSARTRPAARAHCRNSRGAHVQNYTIRVDFGMFNDEPRRRQPRRPKSPFHRA